MIMIMVMMKLYFTRFREVESFKGWPIGMVLDHPQDCLFHFFKRGAVMVPDSKHSEWLYIVKTGRDYS